jgi:hypothetical protein
MQLALLLDCAPPKTPKPQIILIIIGIIIIIYKLIHNRDRLIGEYAYIVNLVYAII